MIHPIASATPAIATAMLLIMLSSCEQQMEEEETVETVDLEGAPDDPPPPAPPPLKGAVDTANDGYPVLTAPVLSPEAERGETGARSVLVNFARAIELQETRQAYSMLSASAQQQWDEASFAAIFEGLEKITVAVPGGTLEGAAGSSYYTSEAEISAEDADGRPVRIEGPIILRRVNDVPGASDGQLHWRIASIDLAQTH